MKAYLPHMAPCWEAGQRPSAPPLHKQQVPVGVATPMRSYVVLRFLTFTRLELQT